MVSTLNATTPKRGKSATIHSMEFARAYSVLKKTPDSRKQKCRELLHEQALLESRLRTVRMMLDAVTNTPVRTNREFTPTKQDSQGNNPANVLGRA